MVMFEAIHTEKPVKWGRAPIVKNALILEFQIHVGKKRWFESQLAVRVVKVLHRNIVGKTSWLLWQIFLTVFHYPEIC